MKTILTNSISLLFISLLTSCSCNKKFDTEINPIIQNDSKNLPKKIKVIDPFIDSEIDFSQTTKYQVTKNKFNNNKTKKTAHTKHSLTRNLVKSKKQKLKNNQQELNFTSYNSGLKYQILSNAPSDNPKPKKGQTVSTHYIGWQNDHGEPGELIDSTYERNLPFEFKIGKNQVIKAWEEGVMDMRVGDKRRFFIPSELAWGKAGVTTLVPSNTDLIYEIEVLAIK